MLTTTATPARRSVESSLASILVELRHRRQSTHAGRSTGPETPVDHAAAAPAVPGLAPRRGLSLPALPAAWARKLRRAREIGADVLEHEAFAMGGMALMFIVFILI